MSSTTSPRHRGLFTALLATTLLLTAWSPVIRAQEPGVKGDWPEKNDVPAKDAGLDVWMEFLARVNRAWEQDAKALLGSVTAEGRGWIIVWMGMKRGLEEIEQGWKEGDCERILKYLVPGRDKQDVDDGFAVIQSLAGIPKKVQDLHLQILFNLPDNLAEELRKRCRDGLLLGRNPRFRWNPSDAAASSRIPIRLEGCLPGIKVALLDSDDSVVAEETTDEDGKAILRVHLGRLKSSLRDLRVRKGDQIMPLRRYQPEEPADQAGEAEEDEEESSETPPDEGRRIPSWGLRSLPFDTVRGRVTVLLPDQVLGGDTLSGRVVIDPAGATASEQERNRKRLERAQLRIGGTSVPVSSGALKWIAASSLAGTAATISLRGAGASSDHQVQIESTAPSSGQRLNLPELGQSGRPISISGPFDGEFDTSSVTIGGQATTLLAESPRELIFEVPATAVGRTRLQLTERGASAESEFRVVSLELTAAKLDLRPGERSTLTLRILGLGGITAPIRVGIINQSRDRVQLQGGDQQTISVLATDVRPGGEFLWRGQLTGLQVGSFEISAHIVSIAYP